MGLNESILVKNLAKGLQAKVIDIESIDGCIDEDANCALAQA